MKIGTREIGKKTFILAEAGTNHLGSRRKALEYVGVAHATGCDGIKFQLFVEDAPLFCPLEGDERRRKRWNQSAMSFSDWMDVRQAAREFDLAFVVSVFQDDAIPLANNLELDAVKVASRANMSFPYKKFDGPFIVSFQNLSVTLRWRPPSNAVWLQCCPKYPTPLRDSFWKGSGGLSDHSGTVWPAIDACLKGADLVEVHFVLPGDDCGPDTPVCLTPKELILICEARDAAATMRED